MSAYKKFYFDIMGKVAEIQNSTFEHDISNIQSKSYSYHNDFVFWIDLLNGRKESILLRNALKEYLVSQILLTQGFYKHSFACLRGFLEQTLFAIQLSTNEISLRQWFDNRKDIYWSSIVDLENGLFSRPYIEAFFSDAHDNMNEFLVMSKEVYRECSEFVHGNFSVEEHTVNLEFKEKTFSLWHQTADTIQLIITFSLFVRYNELINTKSLISKSESIVMEKIGYIESVRDFYTR